MSAYTIKNKNTILNFVDRAENAGEQKITGLDIHLQKEFDEIMMFKKIKMWTYYSVILNEERKTFDDNGNEIGTDIIGDLSHNNVYFGLSNIINDHFSVHIIGKYIGKRKTVATNPIDEIDAYFNTDINFLVRDVLVDGLYIGLKVYNVLDTKYFHPGIKTADAGEKVGYWNKETNTWYGSEGWYNSKLPQPHRYFMLSLIFNL